MLTTDSYPGAAILSTLSAIAGVIAVQVVKRIFAFQSSPLPVQSSSD
ncbi:hypothetical protein ABZX92_07050 [Lentzea sp. NPDC006480]